MAEITPCGHIILVKPDPVEEKTKGGVWLPQQSQDMEKRATTTGVIVTVGSQAWKAFDDGQPWAKEGDTILFARYGGVTYKDKDDQEYRLLNDEDVIAVIK